MYMNLTKLAGSREEVVKEKPPARVPIGNEGEKDEESMEVTTTGRQKFGDTRTMKMSKHLYSTSTASKKSISS
jgi:hypothetical protein